MQLQALYEAAADFSLQMSGECSAADAVPLDLQPDNGQTSYSGWFEHGQMIGMAEYRLHFPQESECYLEVLLVDPPHRNHGLGVRIFSELCGHWLCFGCARRPPGNGAFNLTGVANIAQTGSGR